MPAGMDTTQPRITRRPVWLGLALLTVDALFLLTDMLHRLHITRGMFPAFAHRLWEGDPDGSLLEIWRYVKAVAGGIALVWLWRRLLAAPVLLVAGCILILFFIAADDSLRLHEQIGRAIAWNLGFSAMWNLGGQDFGELLFWAITGSGLLARLMIAFGRSAPQPRRIVWFLVPPLAFLVFFAAIFDGIGPASRQWGWSTRARYLANWAERAGEQLSITALVLVISYFVFMHLRNRGRGPVETQTVTD
ncbi:hypothetical protein [Brevibacterium luteolum]|uniref:hypothetical protein n=1 Tax=Brevibacterium luteolum TaxID=199591 RepID=UPI00223B18BD|nr:hypothetical protein [Brevibacterium luteolum]MCT1658080.1 hypothetical protein [Brevibacterium luteolum]